MSAKYHYFSLILIASINLIQGCRENSHQTNSSLYITGGQIVAANDPIAWATASLVEQDQKDLWVSYCSGTLIAQNLVVTAAHCITSNPVYVQFPAAQPERKDVFSGTAIIHESYGQPYNEPMTFDIAIIHLDKPTSPPMKPVPIGKKGEYKSGDEAILAGYGITSRNDSDFGAKNRDNYLYKTNTRISDIFASGDQDIREDTENWGLITYQSDDQKSGACAGDSGGPMFINHSNTLKVVGITAGGNHQLCDSTGKYTHIEFYSDWIKSNGFRD